MKIKRYISIFLAASLMVGLLGGCGLFKKSGKEKEAPAVLEEGEIDLAEVVIPHSTGLRRIVEGEAAVTLQTYMVARAYLSKLENFDLDLLEEEDEDAVEEYIELLRCAAVCFEVTEELCESLLWDAEVLEELQEEGESFLEGEPVWLESRFPSGPLPGSNPFLLTAYASGKESPALIWAKDITKRFDEAPAGRGIRTLAEQMGTDTKHAYAALQQAQNIMEGADYEDIADTANTAYQVAYGLKAAGTTAGFVVAVAATGGTAGVVGAINVGGAACAGSSMVLDVGEASTIISTNGEGNEYTAAFSNTADKFKYVNTTFGLLGMGANMKTIKDVVTGQSKTTGGVFIGDTKDHCKQLMGQYPGSEAKLWSDLLDESASGILTTIASDAPNYVDTGFVTAAKIVDKEDGVHITIESTPAGDSDEARDAAAEVLKDAGIPKKDVKEILNTDPDDVDEPDFTAFDEDYADAIIDAWDVFTDPDDPFDAGRYIEGVGTLIDDDIDPDLWDDYFEEKYDFYEDEDEYEEDDDAYVDEEEDEDDSYDDAEDEERTSSGKSGKKDKDDKGGKSKDKEKDNDGSEKDADSISGKYRLSAWYQAWPDDVFTNNAEVILHEDNSMEITIHDTVDEHLAGTYNPKTRTFVGQGTNGRTEGLGADFWDVFTTEITFDLSTDPISASGTLGEKGGEWTIGISMEKTDERVKRESGLPMVLILGSYHFTGSNYALGIDDYDFGTFVFTPGDDGDLRGVNEEMGLDLVFSYNQSSGQAKTTTDNWDMTVSFIRNQNRVSAGMSLTTPTEMLASFTADQE